MSSSAVSVIAVVAFLLSALTFIASQVAASRSGRVSALDRCMDEREQLQKKLDVTKEQLTVIQEENYRLMRRLTASGNDK